MTKYELKLPNMGESVAEATLTSWLKKVGEVITIDDAVVEVATDKVDSEVVSEYTGVLVVQNFKEGDVIKVGETIAVLEIDDAIAENEGLVQEIKEEVAPEEVSAEIVEALQEPLENTIAQTAYESPATPIDVSDSKRFYSPLVKNIANKEKVTFEELEQIEGTGSEGRVTKSDIMEYVALRSSKPKTADLPKEEKIIEKVESTPIQTTPIIERTTLIPKSLNGQHELIEMDRMRKLIATHMRESVETSVHVQSFMEADVTNIWNWRQNTKEAFQKREGENLTFTPIFMLAIAKALRDYPMMNISVEGTTIIKKKDINIGMATALPSGNLIVPVIKNADTLSLVGMVRVVNDFAKRAKSNSLKPDEVADGTFTVTNIGSFGSLFGTPIINQPQVGILAIGAIRKVPAVIETAQGDFIGIRNKMFITHAYDHRVVDGALGGMFLKRVVEYLENWNDKKNCF